MDYNDIKKIRNQIYPLMNIELFMCIWDKIGKYYGKLNEGESFEECDKRKNNHG